MFLPFPALTIINERFSPCSSNPIFPSIFAPSISPSEKQATNVLNPALTIPETSKDRHRCCGCVKISSCKCWADLDRTWDCSVPSSGRIAAISCIPPVRVEPIPPLAPLDGMASRWKIYRRRGVVDEEWASMASRHVEQPWLGHCTEWTMTIYYCKRMLFLLWLT